MKRFLKPLWIGLLIGAVELGAAGLLAGVGRLASFTDLAFGLGVATLLFGLLLLLGGRHRVQAGMGTVNLFSPTASTAFQAQVSYDEAKNRQDARPALGWLPGKAAGRLRGCRRGAGGVWRQLAVLKKAQKKARLPWGGRALLLCYASSGRGVKVNSWKVPWEAPSANIP